MLKKIAACIMLVAILTTSLPAAELFVNQNETTICEELSAKEMNNIIGGCYGDGKSSYEGTVKYSGDCGSGSVWASNYSNGLCLRRVVLNDACLLNDVTFHYKQVTACETCSFNNNGYYYLENGCGGPCTTNTLQASFQIRVHGSSPDPSYPPGVQCIKGGYADFWGSRWIECGDDKTFTGMDIKTNLQSYHIHEYE